jgi:hypothetical protein
MKPAVRHPADVATADPASVPSDLFLAQNFPLADGEPPGMLADAIDPQTGELLSIERGFDPTDAAVIQAMRVQEATGTAVQNTGNRMSEIKLIDDHFPQHAKAEGARMVEHLTDAGDLALLDVEVESEFDTGEVQLFYENLARGTKPKITAPLVRGNP